VAASEKVPVAVSPLVGGRWSCADVDGSTPSPSPPCVWGALRFGLVTLREERLERARVLSALIGQPTSEIQHHILIVAFQRGEPVLWQLPFNHERRAHLRSDKCQGLSLQRSLVRQIRDFDGLPLPDAPGAAASLTHHVNAVLGLVPADRRPVDKV
jgi:hypothetical protein